MKIINTFAIVNESLYSVQYETEDNNEFAKCFNLWNDPVYLREFFEEHQELLNNDFWNGISIEDAIKKTRKDAKILEQEILELAEIGKNEKFENLSSLFEPLTRGAVEEFEMDKAKGLSRKSWLRIYAVRIDKNFFVVSGAAIKLTHRMEDADYLIKELEKLNFVRDTLKGKDSEELEFFELNL